MAEMAAKTSVEQGRENVSQVQIVSCDLRPPQPRVLQWPHHMKRRFFSSASGKVARSAARSALSIHCLEASLNFKVGF